MMPVGRKVWHLMVVLIPAALAHRRIIRHAFDSVNGSQCQRAADGLALHRKEADCGNTSVAAIMEPRTARLPLLPPCFPGSSVEFFVWRGESA